MYDLIIVGAGPAGLTAAIYAVRKKIKTLVISKDIGGQAAISGDIENYLGYAMITGPELAQKFRQHVEEFEELELLDATEVTNLEKVDSIFKVTTNDGKTFEARAVIIASGRVPRLLGIPGEKEMLGRGVATCATCDAPLFAGKEVAVVGGGNSAMDAIFSLLKVAKKVYSVNINPDLTGDEVLKKQVTQAPNVELIGNVQTSAILNDGQKVTAIEIQDKNGGEKRTIPVQGVFIEIGQIPSVQFDHLTEKDKYQQILSDPDTMATNIQGIFTAGDVNNHWGEQIIIAAGEGSKAALRAAEYLSRLPIETQTQPQTPPSSGQVS